MFARNKCFTSKDLYKKLEKMPENWKNELPQVGLDGWKPHEITGTFSNEIVTTLPNINFIIDPMRATFYINPDGGIKIESFYEGPGSLYTLYKFEIELQEDLIKFASKKFKGVTNPPMGQMQRLLTNEQLNNMKEFIQNYKNKKNKMKEFIENYSNKMTPSVNNVSNSNSSNSDSSSFAFNSNEMVPIDTNNNSSNSDMVILNNKPKDYSKSRARKKDYWDFNEEVFHCVRTVERMADIFKPRICESELELFRSIDKLAVICHGTFLNNASYEMLRNELKKIQQGLERIDSTNGKYNGIYREKAQQWIHMKENIPSHLYDQPKQNGFEQDNKFIENIDKLIENIKSRIALRESEEGLSEENLQKEEKLVELGKLYKKNLIESQQTRWTGYGTGIATQTKFIRLMHDFMLGNGILMTLECIERRIQSNCIYDSIKALSISVVGYLHHATVYFTSVEDYLVKCDNKQGDAKTQLLKCISDVYEWIRNGHTLTEIIDTAVHATWRRALFENEIVRALKYTFRQKILDIRMLYGYCKCINMKPNLINFLAANGAKYCLNHDVYFQIMGGIIENDKYPMINGYYYDYTSKYWRYDYTLQDMLLRGFAGAPDGFENAITMNDEMFECGDNSGL